MTSLRQTSATVSWTTARRAADSWRCFLIFHLKLLRCVKYGAIRGNFKKEDGRKMAHFHVLRLIYVEVLLA